MTTNDKIALQIALLASVGCAPSLVRDLRAIGVVIRVNHSAEIIAAVNDGARLIVADLWNWVALTKAAREHIRAKRQAGRVKVVLIMEQPARISTDDWNEVDMRLRSASTSAEFSESIHSLLLSSGFLGGPRSPSSDSLPRPVAESIRVLIVDDSNLTNRITTAILGSAGYQVLCITNPFEMRLAIKEYKPDIVLVDYNMPALRGDALIEINQRGGLSIPMLLYSNASNDLLAATAHRCGAAGYILKSAPQEILLSRIAECIKSTAAASAKSGGGVPALSRQSDSRPRIRQS